LLECGVDLQRACGEPDGYCNRVAANTGVENGLRLKSVSDPPMLRGSRVLLGCATGVLRVRRLIRCGFEAAAGSQDAQVFEAQLD